MYNCDSCLFSTKFLNNFRCHLKSNKHLDNCKLDNFCHKCLNKFKHAGALTNHLKKCDVDLCPMKKVIKNNTNSFNTNSFNTNININLPKDASAETINHVFMSIKQLLKKKTTNSLQKVILDQMSYEDYDIMDYIEDFDNNIEIEKQIFMSRHYKCYAYEYVEKIDKNGNKYKDKVKITPLSHPNYEWNCEHTRLNFSLNPNDVARILSNTLLNSSKLVVTHDNNLIGKGDILFKHKKLLYLDTIILDFLDKSTKKEYFDIPVGFRITCILEKDYPEFYKKLELKAVAIMNASNRVNRKTYM